MIDHSVMQPSLVPMGVLETRTLSGKTGITTTALSMAPASVEPAPTAILMTIRLAQVARNMLLAAAMRIVSAVLLRIVWLLVMVGISASHPPAIQSFLPCDQSIHCEDPAGLQVFFQAFEKSHWFLVSDDPALWCILG